MPEDHLKEDQLTQPELTQPKFAQDLYVIVKISDDTSAQYKLIKVEIDSIENSNFQPISIKEDCYKDIYNQDNNFRIKNNKFKILHDDIQSDYIVYTAIPNDVNNIVKIFSYKISSSKLTELSELQMYDFLNKDNFKCVFDINHLLYFIYNNRLITTNRLTGQDEIYIDDQEIGICMAGYTIDSVFSTAYNGLIYSVQKSSSGYSVQGYNINVRGSHNVKKSNANRETIRFIKVEENDEIIICSEEKNNILYDYSLNRYTVAQSYTNASYLEIKKEIPNGENKSYIYSCNFNIPKKPEKKPADMDTNFELTNDFLYLYYDISNKIIGFNIIEEDGGFDIRGFICNLNLNTKSGDFYKYIYCSNGDTSTSYEGKARIPYNLVKVLPYNSMTTRKIIQPNINITYKQPFYDINDTLKIEYIVNVSYNPDKKGIKVKIELIPPSGNEKEINIIKQEVKPEDFNKTLTVQWNNIKKEIGLYHVNISAEMMT